MSINQRFEIIINRLFAGKKSAFAAEIGITPSVVDNIVGKRKGNPSFEVLEKVSAIAEIRMEWLIRGVGEPFFDNEGNMGEETKPSSSGYDSFMNYVKEKDALILEQAIEIGKLTERVKLLEAEVGNQNGMSDMFEDFLEEVTSEQSGAVKAG